MLKRIVITLALVMGVIAATAQVATAEPNGYLLEPQDSTSNFVNVFDLAAYGSRIDAWLIVSPYGTSQPITCASFHGQTGCSQTDLWGNQIPLNKLFLAPGSSTYMARPVYVFAP
nr:hypothetical protein [Rhodococcus sp. (in: high G+C Gram-positive bacteria)]